MTVTDRPHLTLVDPDDGDEITPQQASILDRLKDRIQANAQTYGLVDAIDDILVQTDRIGRDDDDDAPPYTMIARDDLDGRMRHAIESVATWYQQAQAAQGEDDSFSWGRQLYHVMRPVEALHRKLQGLPPANPCTHCGTEESGASFNMPNPGDKLCTWCARDLLGY